MLPNLFRVCGKSMSTLLETILYYPSILNKFFFNIILNNQKMKKLSFAVITLLALGFHGTFAQSSNAASTVTVDIPAHAYLAIAGTSSLTMPFTKPTAAGLAIVAPTANSTLWLNYSSIVTAVSAAAGRTISVKTSALIPGVDVKVAAATPVMTNGNGTGGVGSAALILTATDQSIVTGIGSCQTGTGTNSGSQLTYDVLANLATYGSLIASTPVVTVTYTMTEL